MSRFILTATIHLGIIVAAVADVDKEELKKLFKAGVSDDLIVTYVHSKGPLARLSADDVVDLKKAGLSDGLLSRLIPLADTTPAPAKSKLTSTAQAMEKLLSDPDIVYDGRYFYPRSYFSSDHTAYTSAGIGIVVASVDPLWCRYRSGGSYRPTYTFAWTVGRCGPRACYR